VGGGWGQGAGVVSVYLRRGGQAGAKAFMSVVVLGLGWSLLLLVEGRVVVTC